MPGDEIYEKSYSDKKKIEIVYYKYSYNTVSYTHLDVYKRQFYMYVKFY